ncbi:unnamed protein product [Schistosoma curassoni]|uniref:ABC transporter ATP-binding protein n=1 Tax=Schistosoma curassoni TaxID=6186 RepID=A0A183L386_9TREM|nr:unnamed protein product [Schistosoma curassoni]
MEEFSVLYVRNLQFCYVNNININLCNQIQVYV